MDPDEALRQIRLFVKQMQVEDDVPTSSGTRPEFTQHARDLMEAVDALDTWISGGGFLPAAWKEKA